MNQQTAAGHQVDTGLKAELAEIVDMLKEMGDARNFEQAQSSGGGIDSVANRTVDMQGMLKELRRTLPATYFRNNSRVKRIFDQIVEAHETNREEVFALRQNGGSASGMGGTSSFLEKIERCKRRLNEVISRI